MQTPLLDDWSTRRKDQPTPPIPRPRPAQAGFARCHVTTAVMGPVSRQLLGLGCSQRSTVEGQEGE